jgi:hypothetical protein
VYITTSLRLIDTHARARTNTEREREREREREKDTRTHTYTHTRTHTHTQLKLEVQGHILNTLITPEIWPEHQQESTVTTMCGNRSNKTWHPKIIKQ